MSSNQTDKPKGKYPGGRPTKYNETFHPILAEALARNGLIDKEICKKLGISEGTMTTWKKEYPKFLLSIKKGKENPDDQVEQALFKRALGYEHPEDDIKAYEGKIIITPTIKHYPPDTAAAFIWLKNRRPDKWRDRKEMTGAEGGPIEIKIDKKFDGI
jgi:hypothetical protein